MRVFSRGANFLGQCGQGRRRTYLESFTQISSLTGTYTQLESNYGQNYLVSTSNEVFYWGYTYDSSSFLKLMKLFNYTNEPVRLLCLLHPGFYKFPFNPSLIWNPRESLNSLSVGAGHAVAVTESGDTFLVGENFFNQLGIVSNQNVYSFTKQDNLEMTQNPVENATCGLQHTLFLDSENRVFGCGKSDNHQFGNRDSNYSFKSIFALKNTGKIIELDTRLVEGKIKKIAAGKYHSVILTEEGKVYSVGLNRYGQTGQDVFKFKETVDFHLIEFDEEIVITDVACGDEHNIFLSSEGKVYVNGSNKVGQINGNSDNLVEYQACPVEVELPEPVNKVKAANFKNVALTSTGKAYFWGGIYYSNEYSIYKQPQILGINEYSTEEGIEGKEVLDVGLGLFHEIVLTN